MIDRLDRIFLALRATPFCLRFTLFTRILLAAGFIPTGMVKLMGERFTLLGPETSIGAFFEAMYQTGLYWRFLGASQVLAGVLLLFPRLAHLGAALFLPIITNIFVVTVALGFQGTPFVTGPMLLAVTWLCAWDWHRLRGLFADPTAAPAPRPPKLALDPLEAAGFAVFAAALVCFFGMTRGLAAMGLGVPTILVGVLAGLFTLGRFVTTGRRLGPSAGPASPLVTEQVGESR